MTGVLLLLALTAAAPSPVPFRLTAVAPVEGKAPEWDYLTWDAAHNRLFIGRRDDGLAVFDPAAKRIVATVADTAGAGAATLIPALDRGFSVNEDGSTTAFTLSTLRPVKRLKIADDADSAVYEPVTAQLLFLSGDSKRISFVDPARLIVRGTLATASAKLEASAADGTGRVFIAERDRNAILVVDARTRSIAAEWPVAGCAQPTGLAFDSDGHRLYVGCRGDHPVLAVVDAASGTGIATTDLGRGNDGVIWDAASGRVFAANGVDANIVVYHATADGATLDHAFTTRPGARTIAYDPAHGTLFSVTAAGIVDPTRPVNRGPSPFHPNRFVDDSFVVLTFQQPSNP